MSDKIYFEMSEAERQLHLLQNNLDYAICILSEGLPVPEDQFHGINEGMLSGVVDNITSHLTSAFNGVNFLMEALDEERVTQVRIPSGLLAEIESEYDDECR
jgi:hypothetical protein